MALSSRDLEIPSHYHTLCVKVCAACEVAHFGESNIN